jgi:hypothetical protein
MQLILNRLVESLGELRFGIVINAALGIDIGYLLIEPALTGPDLPDPFE